MENIALSKKIKKPSVTTRVLKIFMHLDLLTNKFRQSITQFIHRPNPYVEWWYFHFTSPEGAAINMILHETDIFGLRDRPYLSLSIMLPDLSPRYFRAELDSAIGINELDLLDDLHGWISNHGDKLKFCVNPTKECRFSGEILKLAEPIIINEGNLYQNPATGRSSKWIIPIPHATFTATLRIDDKLIKLSGTAYHDHQWGNILIQNYVSDWIWGHFSNEQIAITFFQILTQNGQIIEWLSFISPEGIFIGTLSNTNYLETLINNNDLKRYTNYADIGFLFNKFEVGFDIHPSKLMRCRLNEKHGEATANYTRWLAQAMLNGGC